MVTTTEIETDFKSASILVVDDEASNVTLLERMLKIFGYTNVIKPIRVLLGKPV